jgi:predicted lipoprotein with Yx(FWY)xxD motif
MTIKTTTLTVGGKSMTVLTNAQGLTLYYRTSDTPTSVCSGGCASTWPPVLSTSMPSVSGTLPGKLSLLTDANGSQVAYNGHLLYTYSGDSAPSQANGQGIGGVWFVAPTTLPATTTPPGSATPTPGGYYHQP